MHFIWTLLILDYLPSIGSCLKSDCPAKKVMKTPIGKSLHSIGTNTCLLLIYLTLPISSPVYGIISRCPIDRIQVISDNPIDASWFWSASKTCPITVQQLFGLVWKSLWTLEGSSPRQDFHQDFASNSLVSVVTQVFLRKLNNFLESMY